LPIVVRFRFGKRGVPDRFEQPLVIEPGNPFQRCEFDCLAGFLRCPAMNQFGLVEAVDGFRECAVVAVAVAAI
jgi:hypothetical protein